MSDKEKVYTVNVIGVNQDWTCGWGKEKKCINYDIRKNGLCCKCVLFYCIYITSINYTVIVILKENMYM